MGKELQRKPQSNINDIWNNDLDLNLEDWKLDIEGIQKKFKEVMELKIDNSEQKKIKTKNIKKENKKSAKNQKCRQGTLGEMVIRNDWQLNEEESESEDISDFDQEMGRQGEVESKSSLPVAKRTRSFVNMVNIEKPENKTHRKFSELSKIPASTIV